MFSLSKVYKLQDTDIKNYRKKNRYRENEEIKKKEFEMIPFDETKKYIEKYIFVLYTGTYMVWDNKEHSYIPYNEKNLKNAFTNYFIDPVKKWFWYRYIKRYNVVTEVNKPRKYDDNLNLFCGLLHNDNIKPSSDYDYETQEYGKYFLNYMLDVLCDGNKEEYNFLCKWIATVLHGEKNNTILYLKGDQGIGKSYFNKYLAEYIIGRKCVINSDCKPLTGDFNDCLAGKLLVIFEELPNFGRSQWEGVSAKLKTMSTENYMLYNGKHKAMFESKNINNYIINTNVNAIKDSEGRRYFMMDLSTQRKGDKKYWKILHSKDVMNEKVGEYLFNYFYEKYEKCGGHDFNMPITRSKLDAISERLHPIYTFIVEGYIRQGEDLDKRLIAVYNEYREYATLSDYKICGKNSFNRKLKDIGIISKKSNGHTKFSYPLDQLVKIAYSNHWISELDDDHDEIYKDYINKDSDDNNDDNDSDDDDDDDDNDYKKRYLEAMEKIKQLEDENETLREDNAMYCESNELLESELEKLNDEYFTLAES